MCCSTGLSSAAGAGLIVSALNRGPRVERVLYVTLIAAGMMV